MNVMKRAWEIARKGAAKFGGSVKAYFAQSLKMAWAEAKSVKTTPVNQKIAVAFESIARLSKVDDLEVQIKYWEPADNAEKARIYFNVGGTRKQIADFYYAVKEDRFYSWNGGNTTKREAVDNAIKIARANVVQIISEYVPQK